MFDEKNSHALQLCTIIEKCIFHGTMVDDKFMVYHIFTP